MAGRETEDHDPRDRSDASNWKTGEKSLEGDAAQARDQAERDALEDEIARLRNALIAALESTLGSGSG